MNNAINDLKIRFERYQSTLSKKEQIEAEYNSWNELYIQTQNMVAEAESVYNTTNDSKDLEELNSWIDQNSDYLSVVMSQAKMLEDISAELDDCHITDEQIEYMAAVNQHQILSDEMRKIEKISKKKIKNVEPEYIVKVPNAEGRDEKIFLPLVEDYKKLVERKRALGLVVKQTYKVVVDQLEEKNKVIDPIRLDDESTVNDNNDIAGRKAEIEAEMAKLEAEMDSYTKMQGRKTGFRSYGKLVVTPRKYKGLYELANQKWHKLQNELENLEKVEAVDDSVNFSVNNDNSPKVTQEETNAEKLIRLYNENYVKDEYEDIYSNSGTNAGSKGDDFDIADDPQIMQAVNLVNKHHDDYVAKMQTDTKSKPNGFMKILNKRKPINKEKLKNSIKCAVVGIVGVAVIATSTYLSGFFSKKNSNTQSTNDITSSQVGNLTDDKKDDYFVTTPEGGNDIYNDLDVSEEKNLVRLGDKFNIKNDSPIYNTMYDAHLQRTGGRPYFSAGYERTIGGVVVNYEGDLYMFYTNDASAQENVDTLLANGGKITGVLSENASGYEGFYNINDVKILEQNLGGNSR